MYTPLQIYREIRNQLTSTVFSNLRVWKGEDSSGFSPSDNLPASITRRGV